MMTLRIGDSARDPRKSIVATTTESLTGPWRMTTGARGIMHLPIQAVTMFMIHIMTKLSMTATIKTLDVKTRSSDGRLVRPSPTTMTQMRIAPSSSQNKGIHRRHLPMIVLLIDS